MAVVFALFAALSYGVSDFLGGFASRRRAAISVLLHSYPVGALLMIAMLPLFPGTLTLRTTLFGIAGGAVGLVGVVLLYSALAIAPMNIVSPVTAVMTALLPLVVGVLSGERPGVGAWVGIVLGLAAVVLVSYTTDDHPHGRVGWKPLTMALLAGVGFGSYFVFLAKADSDSGMWPLVISRITSAALIVPLALAAGAFAALHGRVLLLAVIAGVLDAFANFFFLEASRHGLLSVASVITSLYPAGTVMLAAGVLKERTGRTQRVGLAMAVASIVLLAR